jgi:hypothetical protein
MTNEAKNNECFDDVFFEPLGEDEETKLENAYVMVVENNSIISVLAPPPNKIPNFSLTEATAATFKLDASVLHRFEKQQRAIKKIEEQQRELKLMYKK